MQQNINTLIKLPNFQGKLFQVIRLSYYRNEDVKKEFILKTAKVKIIEFKLCIYF